MTHTNNSDRLVVTTAYKPAAEMIARAEALAAELTTDYAERRRNSVAETLRRSDATVALIVHPNRLTLLDREGLTYDYHPNMLLLRGLNALGGSRDLFLEAAQLMPGASLIDCTLGFGCEASLAALTVGVDGRVIGLESSPALAAVTRYGLANYALNQKPLRDAMRRVEVVTASYVDYLSSAASRAVDVVYLDPFFAARTEGSEHTVGLLARFGDRSTLHLPSLREAQRVARRAVIVKHPWDAVLPSEIIDARSAVVDAKKSACSYSVLAGAS